MTEKRPSDWRSDKWLAALFWLVLVVAALFTSAQGISAIVGDEGFGGITGLLFQEAIFDVSVVGASDTKVLTLAGVILAAIAVANIGLAWFKVAQLSRRLVIAFAWLEEQSEEITVFSDWLELGPVALEQTEDDEGPDLDLAEGTLVNGAIRNLAFAWIFLLAMSPVVTLLRLFL